MPKNIVICCDGTGNKFGKYNTNVVKMCEVLDRTRQDQVVYYDPGVGTMGDQRAITKLRKGLTRMLGAAIGFGIRDDIAQAYDFLAGHHQDGDKIFVFGFSRGAYTARALAALVHMYGLTAGGLANLTPYIVGMHADDDRSVFPWRALSSSPNRWRTANSFKKIFGRKVAIHFLGVFDTVKSVGWLWSPLKLPFTAKNKSIRHVRHAVAIDERRAFFRTNLLKPCPTQDFQEVWFPGVHSDIGGGYKHDEQGLAQVAFHWMVKEASTTGLFVDRGALAQVLSGTKYAAPDSKATMHHSLDWRWIALEFLPQPRVPVYTDRDGRMRWQLPLYLNLCRRRPMASNAAIHQSVVDRWKADLSYRPSNLQRLKDHPVVQ